MSIPTAVFLDTSILAGQQFNFQSTALSTFVPACAARSLKLLLPDPTDREIAKHMADRSVEALETLEQARRRVPFLAKWPGLQPPRDSPQVEKFKVQHLARQAWSEFLKQFTVVKLGYEDLNVKAVMGWYDQIQAPFSEKKRKEFPDAFALAMLEAYARKEGVYIAVVSADTDFKLACDRFGGLLHFNSLPRLTELLLSDDTRVEKLRTAIQQKLDILETAILDEMPGVSFEHRQHHLEVRDVAFEEIEGLDQSIVAVGDGECTVTFDALVRLEVKLRWEDQGPEGPELYEREVRDRAEVSGTAKIAFEERTGEVSSVTLLQMEDQNIRLTETPFGGW